MRRALTLPVSLACCLSALTVQAEDAPEQAAPTLHPPGTTPPSAPANIDSAFSILVELGDKARQRGNINDAVNAYFAALELKNDATIRGRLGLIAAQINEPVAAAGDLLEAIERGGGSTSKEMDEFHRAYKSVRPRVCNLHITGNVFDADVAIDDGKARREIGTTFKLFVTPGPHLVHGRSETRGEARTQVDCPKGGEGFAVLEWRASNAVPAQAPPAKTIIRRETAQRLVVVHEGHKPIARASDPPKSRGRLSFGADGVMLIGAAPTVAIGAGVFGNYRSGGISGMVHVRGARNLDDVNGAPINVFTLGGVAGPCFHWEWLNSCALASLNLFQHQIAQNGVYYAQTNWQAVPGVGIGISATYRISQSYAVRLSGDIIAMIRNISIAEERGGTVSPIWDGGRFIAAVSAGLTFQP